MGRIQTEKIGAFLIITEVNNREQKIKTVFFNYIPVVRFKLSSLNERRIAAVELVERTLCNIKIAGLICGFHRNTVTNLLKIKHLLGIEALLEDNRGQTKPVKYLKNIRSRIKKMIKKYPDCSDREIAEEASLSIGIEISRSAVCRIRTGSQENTIPKKKEVTKTDLIDMAKIAERIDGERFDDRQLQLNFEKDPELKGKSEKFSKEPSPKGCKDSENVLIKRLKAGERNVFAGGLMHNLFLEEIDIDSLFAPLPKAPDSTYQSRDILITLIHSVLQGIPSIEALKLINATEFGVLAGLNRSPEKETVRDYLSKLCEEELGKGLIDSFAHFLIEKGAIDQEVFFIDGHFLPYYGMSVIAKGYHTVRRIAMRGNEVYVITDLQGKPLFFITESNEIDFRPIISRAIDSLIDLKIQRPVLVFDRGGYGIHFFQTLNDRADFVTWAKYIGSQSLKGIPDESFKICLEVNGKRYVIAEQERIVQESVTSAKKENREKPTSVKLRLIVLQNIKTGKRMGIYTNNFNRSASDIAYYMLQRWGESENFFKEMMARFNFNYHPGYDIKELEKQPLVENPDIVLIKKSIKDIKQECESLKRKILMTEGQLTHRKDKRLEDRIKKLEQTIEENRKHIINFEEKLTTLPDKVSIIDLLKGKPMNRSDLEKKRLYDLMQMIAFHSRERLVELFRKCYQDSRDVKQVLDMITNRSGYVKLIGKTLVVVLDWIENKKHRVAADRFCRILNKIGMKLTGRLKVKLFFHLSRIPHHGTGATKSGELHILS